MGRDQRGNGENLPTIHQSSLNRCVWVWEKILRVLLFSAVWTQTPNYLLLHFDVLWCKVLFLVFLIVMLVFFFCVKMSQFWQSDKICPIMLEVMFDRYSSNNSTFSNSLFNPILCKMSQFCQFEKIMSQKEIRYCV